MDQSSGSIRTSSLKTSYRLLASFREVWRAVGTETTRTFVNFCRRWTPISSPALTAWDDFAAFPLIDTRPASHSFWAKVRRSQRRLAFRKRSRRKRIVPVESFEFRVLIQRCLNHSRTRKALSGTQNSKLAFTVSGRSRAASPSFFQALRQRVRCHCYRLSFPAQVSEWVQPRRGNWRQF